MKTRTILIAATLSLAPHLALAQAGTPIEQNRTDRRPPEAPHAQPPAQAQNPAPTVSLSGDVQAATPLRHVVVEGSSLPATAFERAMAPLRGRPLDRATVTAAAQAAATVYEGSDVALFTVQAPAQDLSGGVLRLRVIEGYIIQVKTQGDTGRGTARVRRLAAKLTRQKPLRRSTLQRYLSLINDTPGVTVTPQMLQGQTPGAVVLALGLKVKRWDYQLSLTNRGNSELGATQLQADFIANNLMRDGDSTTLSVAAPSQVSRFQYYALSHSEPIGLDGLRAQGNVGYIRTHPGHGVADGHTTVAGAQLIYPAVRSYNRNLYLTLDVDGLDSANAVVGSFVTTSERTRAVRGAAAWTATGARYLVQANATASLGKTSGGGFAGAGGTDDRFRKLSARVAFNHTLGKQWTVRTKATVQLTPDKLPASELAPLGGDDFGRAFTQATLLGDRLEAGSLELGWRPPDLPKPVQGSELYGFVDGGETVFHARFGLPQIRQDLASAGLGTRVVWKQKTVIGLEGACGIDEPASMNGSAWRLGVSFRTQH